MQDIVARSLAQRRLTMVLMIGFGGLALLLSAVGIYGVVAYGVSQRFREFGIRIAIGATSGRVTRDVLWQGATMAIAGAVVGLILAVTAAGVMRTLVFDVAPRDVASFLVATLVLMIVTMIASYAPARRAASVDPAIALRAE
jgi:ABC-type antimicrobial peptide transport system permease subunit